MDNRTREKRLGRDLPPEWLPKHCCRDDKDYGSGSSAISAYSKVQGSTLLLLRTAIQ
jgi:hypothetical protein